ncbi:MAG TPA: hypothetical protein VMW12_12195 [Candidatus Dormibacteraeota bacterium]|nr:hypothetical protein [Candidatus Dormibacteraeota bacterium]
MNAAPPPSPYTTWLRTQRAAIERARDVRTRKEANAQLAALLRAVAADTASGPPRAPDAATLAAAARRELATPGRYRLRAHAAAPRTSWWQILWGAAIDRWKQLIGLLARSVRFGGPVRTTVGDLLIVGFLGIVGYAAAQLIRSVQFRYDRRLSTNAPIENARNAQALFERADAAARAGDFATAIRMLFVAAVTLLDLRGVLRDRASATINELRAALGPEHRNAEGPFVAIARQFSRVAYAEVPPGAEDWRIARDSYHALAERIATT